MLSLLQIYLSFLLLPRNHHNIAMVIVLDCAHHVLVVAKVLVKGVKVVVRTGVLQHVPMDVTKHVQTDAGMVVQTHV